MWLVFALTSAVCFGLRGALYQWSSQRPMNRSLMLCGVFSTGALLCLTLSFLTDSSWSPANMVGMMMGMFSFLASMSMYRGFAVGKASLIAILTALPPIVVVVLAFLLLGERLTWMQLISFAVILSGILLIRYSSDLSIRELKGAGWGLACMLFFGFNDVTSKISTELGATIMPTLFFMFGTGTACFFVMYRLEQRRARRRAAADAGSAGLEIAAGSDEEQGISTEKNRAVEPVKHTEEDGETAEPPELSGEERRGAAGRTWSNARTYFWGMLVGTTNAGGMILILHAFKDGITGLVSAVIALNVIIILLYSRFFLRESFTPREAAGIITALAGVIMLRMLG